MLTISIHQALMLWHQLEECYYRDNSYAGDEAEIYAFTLMPNHPAGDDLKDYEAASQALFEIGNLFCRTKECTVVIDRGPWTLPAENVTIVNVFTKSHLRIHVKVVH